MVGGCARPDPVAQQGAAIMGGTDDTTDTNVVGIVLLNGSEVATCSGSLLLPNLVLTARHCVSQMSTQYFACSAYTDPTTHTSYVPTTAAAPYPAGDFYVTTEATLPMGATGYVAVAEVIVPPNSTSVPSCGKDIALLRLATPITGVTPLIPRLDVAPLANENFTAIGYGATDGTGTGTGAGTRRIRSGLQILAVGAQSSGSVQFTADQEWIGNTGTCEGDSGGPALDLLGQILGSVSRGGAGTCDQPIYTGVDAWASFIRSTAAAAATAGGIAPPSWITPPADNSANFGDPCSGDNQCVAPLSCLIIGTERRCTDTGCACPTGWICGSSGEGYQACVPDPNATPDAGNPATDSGSSTGSDAGTTTTDGGTTPADAGTGTGTGHGGCSAAPGGTSSSGSFALAASALLGLTFVSRRRVRRAARHA